MNWNYNEIVRTGNSQARVKNFYPETGFIILHDIKGVIEAGNTIIGDESGAVLTLTEFNVALEYEMGYESTYFEVFLENAVYDGNGNLVAIDEHFTGKPNQDRQITYMVVES